LGKLLTLEQSINKSSQLEDFLQAEDINQFSYCIHKKNKPPMIPDVKDLFTKVRNNNQNL
jgi:hypothetical protein